MTGKVQVRSQLRLWSGSSTRDHVVAGFSADDRWPETFNSRHIVAPELDELDEVKSRTPSDLVPNTPNAR